MKEPQHWNEEELRQALQEADLRPQPGDWSAMESLLDSAEEGFPALPDTLPPGPALPEGWSHWLLGGLFSGLLLLMVHAAQPQAPSAGQIRHEVRIPDRQMALSDSGEPASVKTPEAPAPVSEMVASDRKTTSARHSAAAVAGAAGSPVRRQVSGMGPGMTAGDQEASERASLPPGPTAAVATVASPASLLRPEVRDIRELPEEAYNTGLMAISRLRRPIRPLLTDPAPPASDALPWASGAVRRWRIGPGAGFQMAVAPENAASPLQPWLGAQVRYLLNGGWFLQSGIGATWLNRRGYYGQDLPEGFSAWSSEESLSVRRAEGLLVLQLPLVAGLGYGRWYGMGGMEVSAGIPLGPRQSLRVEEIQSSSFHPDLAGAPRNPGLGLTVGAGYFLSRNFSLEMRYHHGFGVFLPATASRPERRQRDLRLSLGWWW